MSEINLEKYADRIGLSMDLRPDFATLDAIQFSHSTHIPFENLSILLHQPIVIEPSALQEKLIIQRRGGYCFEQNGLLLEALLQIGFDVRPHAARVRMGSERSFLPPRTHLFLQVDLKGETWIVDSGVGGMSLTSPIKFELDTVQQTRHEPRRIIREGNSYFHQAFVDNQWMDVYEFGGEVMPMIDREVSNWWTSTCPHAKFAQNMMAALAKPDGERIGLLNGIFTHRKGSEILRRIEIQSDNDLQQILDIEFGIKLPPETDLGTVGCPWRLS